MGTKVLYLGYEGIISEVRRYYFRVTRVLYPGYEDIISGLYPGYEGITSGLYPEYEGITSGLYPEYEGITSGIRSGNECGIPVLYHRVGKDNDRIGYW